MHLGTQSDCSKSRTDFPPIFFKPCSGLLTFKNTPWPFSSIYQLQRLNGEYESSEPLGPPRPSGWIASLPFHTWPKKSLRIEMPRFNGWQVQIKPSAVAYQFCCARLKLVLGKSAGHSGHW